MTKEAKIINIDYAPSNYTVTNRERGGARNYWKNGVYHKVSFGWDHAYTPSKITVTISVDGNSAEVLVDHYFKKNWVPGTEDWSRLTENRVSAIKTTCPDTIKVDVTETRYGLNYELDGNDMQEWLFAARQAAA